MYSSTMAPVCCSVLDSAASLLKRWISPLSSSGGENTLIATSLPRSDPWKTSAVEPLPSFFPMSSRP